MRSALEIAAPYDFVLASLARSALCQCSYRAAHARQDCIHKPSVVEPIRLKALANDAIAAQCRGVMEVLKYAAHVSGVFEFHDARRRSTR